MANAMYIYNLLKELFLLLDDGDRRLLSQFDLSVSRYYILVHLGDRPGISSRRLSDLMICDKSNITRLVKSLEADGLVRKVPHESDGRMYRLFLTDSGERLRHKAFNAHKMYITRRFACFNQREEERLTEKLLCIKSGLEAELLSGTE